MERVQPSDPRRRPTVVVARRPRPGRESAFEQWLRALVAEAGHADGYLGAELQPPNAQHPDEWVTVYQFRDADRLEAWLCSPSRAALLADGDDLSDGTAREQVLAVAPEDVHVTVVSSYRVLPDRWDRFDAFAHRVLAAPGESEGFVSADVFEP